MVTGAPRLAKTTDETVEKAGITILQPHLNREVLAQHCVERKIFRFAVEFQLDLEQPPQLLHGPQAAEQQHTFGQGAANSDPLSFCHGVAPLVPESDPAPLECNGPGSNCNDHQVTGASDPPRHLPLVAAIYCETACRHLAGAVLAQP